MKKIYIGFSLICLNAALLFAQTPKTREGGISTLVDRIKSAKPEKRRELINQLKVELRTMNKEVRQKTMMDLRTSFAKNRGRGDLKRSQHQTPHNSDKVCNMQQNGQRGGKRQGPQDGSGPKYKDKPHKNNGQQNRGH